MTCLVGTGVGGATLGYALAKAGRRVLFLEKGRAPFLHADTLRGEYPELRFPRVEAASTRYAPLLARAGRCYDEIRDGTRSFVPVHRLRHRRFERPIRHGHGALSFLPTLSRGDTSPTGPARPCLTLGPSATRTWRPTTSGRKQLYRVRGSRDPLRPDDSDLLPPPPLSPRNAELYAHFQRQGLHPYQLPLACESIPGCECCQGYLCARDCKNDAGRICLEPAVRDHGATLLDECEVVRLEAAPDRVTGVVCRWRGRTVTLHADHVILAAGALMTPALLLRSTSVHWPQGLANASGLVGRNLMRHCVDLYLVFTREGGENRFKEVGLSDFYQVDGGKLGTVQSFGLLPPAPILAATVAKDVHDAVPWASPLFGLAQPLLRGVLSQLFKRGVLLATIMEDLPYADNRVVPGPPLGIDYHLHSHDLTRVQAFRDHAGQGAQALPFSQPCARRRRTPCWPTSAAPVASARTRPPASSTLTTGPTASATCMS